MPKSCATLLRLAGMMFRRAMPLVAASHIWVLQGFGHLVVFKRLDTRLSLSPFDHPHMDGSYKRVIQVFQDMLRA